MPLTFVIIAAHWNSRSL